VAWSIKVTEEYAAWFTALIKEDLASATQGCPGGRDGREDDHVQRPRART